MDDQEPQEFVWAFNGENSNFPSGVFRSRPQAEEWIRKYQLCGVLTKFPVGVSVYDYAVAQEWFMPIQEHQRSPKFIQQFSSASLEHFHYDDEFHASQEGH